MTAPELCQHIRNLLLQWNFVDTVLGPLPRDKLFNDTAQGVFRQAFPGHNHDKSPQTRLQALYLNRAR